MTDAPEAQTAQESPASGRTDTAGTETLQFQAEVSRLLDIVVHSLYSEKEIFLRELISNASDACDRLRYAALTQPELVEGDSDYRIEIRPDKEARTLTVSDNGVGMNRDDLVENLGTIARSGTAAFVEQLKAAKEQKDANMALIGQFGVGFYAAFMVADRVEVVTRRAGADDAWRWESDGRGQYTIAPAERAQRGTDVVLHIAQESEEYLEPHRLRHIVKRYSDHIPVPIRLFEAEAEEAETVNQASALWTRPKSEVTEEQYKEFYHHVAHLGDDPWLTLHFRAEGMLEYTGLVFAPSTQPFDLFHPDRKPGVKLYVKRVFITDDCESLVPSWLRFLRGVVDSEDLSLNVSREMLQNDPVVSKIRSGLTKRVLSELEKRSEDAEDYLPFWENFGAVLKEGLYEAFEHRDQILKLARFRSTKAEGEGWTSLADYVERMAEGQEAIYTISGEDIEALRKSPQLEGFRAKGVEVLYLTDPVDEFWMPSVGVYDSKPFRSVTRGGADLSKIKAKDGADDEETEKPAEGETTDLLALLKTALEGQVKDVRLSDRLTDSPVCMVADEGDMDIHLERLLKQHNQLAAAASLRILEINPRHALIKALGARATAEGAADELSDAAWLLLDQARILEGEHLPDPAAFAKRLADAMAKGYAA